jgi:hypothetical protein
MVSHSRQAGRNCSSFISWQYQKLIWSLEWIPSRQTAWHIVWPPLLMETLRPLNHHSSFGSSFWHGSGWSKQYTRYLPSCLLSCTSMKNATLAATM